MKNKITVPFSPPDITEAEIAEVIDTLRSGWITTGIKTKQLEDNVAEYVGSDGCVCMSSQTACAEIALRLLGIGEGDEVITSAYTYTATAAVIHHVGAKIVLVDTQRDSFEMDYDAVAAAITPRTKAIIPVDIGGVPCDYDRVFDVVKSKKGGFHAGSELQESIGRIAILADSAHSLGASRNGRMSGSIADLSAFSFHAAKNLTTAEGGALTWRGLETNGQDEIYKRLRAYTLHGQTKDAYEKGVDGDWEYDVIGAWYKCNMTDLAASVGLAQLKRYPYMLKRRRELIERYDAALRPIGINTLEHYGEGFRSSGHLYMTRIPGIGRTDRDRIIAEMAESGIACNVHYKPLPMLTAYREMGFDIRNFPNALACFENEISLPLYSSLTDMQCDLVAERFIEAVKKICKKY